MSNPIQAELENFYAEEFEAVRNSGLFSEVQCNEISAPFLLKVYDSYFNSGLKIMYVGKETNGWNEKKYPNFGSYLNDISGVHQMINRYENEIDNEPHWNNKFFIEYKKVRNALTNGTTGSVIWNNLLKMDFKKKGKSYSRNSIDHSSQLRDLSKRIFLKEVELLKPDFIIFATSHTYDKVLKDTMIERATYKELFEPKSFWKFKSNGAICYRTWHPQTIKSCAKKPITEYFKTIINDIKLEL